MMSIYGLRGAIRLFRQGPWGRGNNDRHRVLRGMGENSAYGVFGEMMRARWSRMTNAVRFPRVVCFTATTARQLA